MFSRSLTPQLKKLAQGYPVIALLGPRQSGKTTLAKATFSQHIYVSLEDRGIRDDIIQDPKGFLNRYVSAPGIIIDEFQYAPDLLSYIQLLVDEHYRPGYFVLTGSQNFLMNKTISQSLAGRVGILTLLPLSIHELKINSLLPEHADTLIFNGSYPRIYSQQIEPLVWSSNYIETYVERDLRDLSQITNLSLFRKFLGLCAGRIGQILNITSLSNDCGITHVTARAWLSILEASYIIYLLQPHFTNFGKRLIKSPKLYFYDTGLACSLLRISSWQQLSTYYLRGSLFESLIITDLLKQFYNAGLRPSVYFWQDSQKNEIDCIIEQSSQLIPVEIKAGQTINPDFFKGLSYWNTLSGGKPEHSYIVYSGLDNQKWSKGNLISWQNTDTIFSV